MSPLIDDMSLAHSLQSTDDPFGEASSRQDRKVVFFAKVRVLEVPHWSELSEEERSDIWFSSKEFDLSREKQKLTIEKMENGEELDEVNLSSHGLQTNDEHEVRKLTAHEAIHETLAEQRLQWEEGLDDPDLLADVYFECTSYNQCLALERGRQHAAQMAAEREQAATREKLGSDSQHLKSLPGFFMKSNVLESKGFLPTSATDLVSSALDLVTGQ